MAAWQILAGIGAAGLLGLIGGLLVGFGSGYRQALREVVADRRAEADQARHTASHRPHRHLRLVKRNPPAPCS